MHYFINAPDRALLNKESIFMMIMGGFLFLLGLGIVVAYRINSSSFLDNKTGQPLPKKGVYSLGAICMLLGIVWAFFPKDASESSTIVETANNVAKVDTPVVSVNSPSLGMSPEDFRKKLNAKIQEVHLSWLHPVDIFVVQKGQGKDVFMADFGLVGMIGSVNFDGSLSTVTYILGKSEDPYRASASMHVLALITSNILNPEVTSEESLEVITSLLKTALDRMELDDQPANGQVVGKIRYFATAGRATGVWFGFEPVE